MMRILLIQPSQENVYGIKMLPAYPPLGLLSIASVLREKGHAVEVVDMDIDDYSRESLIDKVRGEKPDIIGFTAVTPTFNNALRLAKEIRENSDATLILGGIHATIDAENVVRHGVFDFVVVGEGEDTVIELVEAVERKESCPDKVDGIAFMKDAAVVKTPPRRLIEPLERIPDPAYDLLKNFTRYMPPDAVYKPVATIMTTRGCTGRCTFCCTKQIFGDMKVRVFSVPRIISEIDMLVRRFGVREIHLMDDCFTYNKKRVLEFCAGVKNLPHKLRFVFSNGIRADQVDEEILTSLKGIGLRYVMHGVESANEEILKMAKKGVALDRVRKSFAIAKRLGLETWACFVIGLPGETEETIKESLRFAKEIDPDFAKFFILKPYPGSEVFDELNSKGWLIEMNYDCYGLYTAPVHRLPGLSPERMLYWHKRANREFYLRPGKILSHIARIRTWQQFVLALRGAKLMMSLMK